MKLAQFPDDFLWGAATASYQIEGAAKEGGRGESIWDRFSHTPGKTRNGETGDVACDHYHRFSDDIALMSELGLRSYRFSVAWPRVLPQGKGSPNQAGLDFYQRLIDELLARNIQPMVTLYHWDLPQAMQDRGGWANRDTADYFADYAALLFYRVADRVRLWITHNEPWVTAYVGHAQGRHAPGAKDFPTAVQVTHHLLLSHAKAVQIYREVQPPQGKIGIALNLAPTYSQSDSTPDEQAARVADGFQNRWFLDPVLKGSYPRDMLEVYAGRYEAPAIQPADMALLAQNKIDFLGVNYYFRLVVRAPQKDDFFEETKPVDASLTDMGWEIFPEGLYRLLVRLDTDYGHLPIYITENGAAFKDRTITDGIIDDAQRVEFIENHLRQAWRAIRDGVDLRGYFLWSLMDNFEWSYGYSKRFGIVHVDYETQRRTWKRSAHWYRHVIADNALPAD